MACQALLHKVSPVNPVLEAFNKKHPDHGKMKKA
jgi:hypothetical protein